MRARPAMAPEERLRIESALLEGLEKSEAAAGVVVARACDDYADAGWRLGALLAGLAGTGLAAASPWVPASVLLLAMALGLGLGHAAARLAPVRRLLVTEGLADRRVLARAERAFAASGLGSAGLLIFVALLERRVLLLAGDRVAEVARHAPELVELAPSLAAGARRGRLVEGLLGAVERASALLARHLPAASSGETPAAARAALVVLED